VGDPHMVVANGQRLYPYQSLSDLQNLIWGVPGLYASGTTLCPAPSDLAATTYSSSRIDLSWTDNSGTETGFKVERAPDEDGAPGTFEQIDTVVVAEEPKILPHIENMKKVIANTIGISEHAISIKGKTNEGLGEIGSGQAIAAWAVCELGRIYATPQR
jgi:hypothetical protein